MSAVELPEIQAEYENLRKYGLSHDAALDAIASGEPFSCWCGKLYPDICAGGAQQHVGCSSTRTHWVYHA